MDNDLISDNEQLRLRALCTLGILNTCAEERFDRFTLLAIAAFDLLIALVSLVDDGRPWFKSRQGLALANADPLTNLPNRRMYEFQLGKSLALARRQGTHLALMYLDLDNFKRINDSLGHGAGDAVLVEFGHRVRPALRESDMLARRAGDEFTVALEAVGTVENCEAIAKKNLDVLKQPLTVCGQALRISATIGIAFGGAGATVDTLGQEADAALYASKRQGKHRFCAIAAGREIGASA